MTYEGFEILKGKTLAKVENESDDRIVFTTAEGERYALHHVQDCCESVTVDDIVGDLDDLIGSPIVIAEETTSNENPPGVKPPEYQDSFTWTFYRIMTARGGVTIRWYGDSNGYYSESVDFCRLDQ